MIYYSYVRDQVNIEYEQIQNLQNEFPEDIDLTEKKVKANKKRKELAKQFGITGN